MSVTRSAPTGAPRAILLVEDEPLIRQYVALMLRRLGYDVSVAGSGPEAIALARRQQFDGAVIDFGLPDLDGLETLAQLQLVRPSIVAVVSSGTLSPELTARCIAAGARTLEKPYDSAALARVLEGVA